MVWVFGVLGLGLLWRGLHPSTTYPLRPWPIRWWRHCPVRLDLREKFALCCCAYNEGREDP